MRHLMAGAEPLGVSMPRENNRSYVGFCASRANAHLIAAAPELLSVAHWALARLVSVSDFTDPNSEASRLQIALRQAIAKAEGRH